MNGNELRSKSYRSEKQTEIESSTEKHLVIANENLLSKRVFLGDKTFIYVASLRFLKLGGYKGTKIKTITDLAQYFYDNKILLKFQKNQFKPLELSSIITELYQVEAVIKQEDTTCIDTYGYTVKINS